MAKTKEAKQLQRRRLKAVKMYKILGLISAMNSTKSFASYALSWRT